MDGRLLRLERPGSNNGYSTASWRIANHPGLRISDAQIPASPPCILLQPSRDVDHLIDYLTRVLNESFGPDNGWTLWARQWEESIGRWMEADELWIFIHKGMMTFDTGVSETVKEISEME
ncbi:hypothetical protein HO133_007871 [Letharia lupina]|uniref:Uncharacterized protein n=1 Tax=Letharia lupina TaxID=560253 RepID=A0A8H6CRA5_9LECA|nr:uncharacterized protein HO133_007871 [Letharia lupina]KAF6228143.1 hypothetical protein HO133_007871 [Letharia lupina]